MSEKLSWAEGVECVLLLESAGVPRESALRFVQKVQSMEITIHAHDMLQARAGAHKVTGSAPRPRPASKSAPRLDDTTALNVAERARTALEHLYASDSPPSWVALGGIRRVVPHDVRAWIKRNVYGPNEKMSAGKAISSHEAAKMFNVRKELVRSIVLRG